MSIETFGLQIPTSTSALAVCAGKPRFPDCSYFTGLKESHLNGEPAHLASDKSGVREKNEDSAYILPQFRRSGALSR
jgi:hypothetical protein